MPTRRLILAAPAVLTLCRGAPAWAQGAGLDPFTLGVASGDPSPDGFVIWTRLAPLPASPDGLGGMTSPAVVRWAVARDAGMTDVVAGGEVETDPRAASTVHVELAGLGSGRPYWYRFSALGFESPVGLARTAPARDATPDRLRLTVASCAHYELGYFSPYRHMADEDADLTLFLGDYIYEAGGGAQTPKVREHGAPTCVDLAGYRNRYALHRTDPDLQRLHAAAACLITWDDHEVENDYAGDLSQDVSETPDAFLARRAAAYRAFYEHMPIRRTALNGASMPIHKAVPFGRLAEIYVLDTRQHRSPEACMPPTSRRARVIDPACPERLDPRRSMLGRAQEDWLYGRFGQSAARWNLIAQSVLAAPVQQRDQTGRLGSWTDAWDGYPAARERLLHAVDAARLANPVILSGDIHSFWANELRADPRDPGSRGLATEFVATAVSANSPAEAPFATVRADNPDVRFLELRRHGYVSADLSADRLAVRFRAVSDRRDPNATVETLAAFVVDSGRPSILT